MRKLAVTLLLITGLAACASSPLPEDHYYRLEIDTPAAPPAAPPLAASINVQRINMTGIYGERPLLYSPAQSPTELRQYHYHYWADSPARLIQAQLANHLRAVQLAREVTTEASGSTSEYQIVGAVQRFEQRLAGDGAHAYVEVELTVQRASDGRRVWRKSYRADIATRDRTPLAAAQGLSQALAQCFSTFSADVRVNRLH